MADILIKGMKMPSECEFCPMCEDIDGLGCRVNHLVILRRRGQVRPSWCPLIKVEETKRIGVSGEWETIYQEVRS